MLQVSWDEELREIQVRLMGEVQIEVLGSLIKERFGTVVSFDTGNIVYKETICSTVEGVGHYEPLRHYAEVHLILEPGEAGSGVAIDTDCSEDILDRNWQRLILTHLGSFRAWAPPCGIYRPALDGKAEAAFQTRGGIFKGI